MPIDRTAVLDIRDATVTATGDGQMGHSPGSEDGTSMTP